MVNNGRRGARPEKPLFDKSIPVTNFDFVDWVLQREEAKRVIIDRINDWDENFSQVKFEEDESSAGESPGSP